MKKTFVISDIHGCYDELIALYNQLPIKPEEDRMIFLGDYVDRGRDSNLVIQQLIDWKKKYPHWVMLQGNHEDMLLDALRPSHRIYGDYYQWFNQGGRVTKQSYMPDGFSEYDVATTKIEDIMPREHLNFIATLPRFFEDEKYIYVHGGIRPGLTPWQTDPYDLIWIRDEFIKSNYDWGKKVIFGHTPQELILEPWVMKNKIGIDTAVCYSARNKLTCIELPTEKFYFQVNLGS